MSEHEAPPDPGSHVPPTMAGSAMSAPPSLRITGDAVRGMRHELFTPLNHIIGYCEMLQEDAADRRLDDLIPDLRKIELAGRRLLDRIRDTLDSARTGERAVDPEELSRELRTSLDAIIGYSGLLQETALDQGSQDIVSDLKKIEDAGLRLSGLINALLHLARIEAGTLVEQAEQSAPISMSPSRPRELVPARATIAAHILVVDDNDANREMLARRLERDGHRVSGAANGRDALAMLQVQPFDIVLLDIMMPEMNGYQLLDYLKGDSALRHIPVIMLSSLDELASVVRCIELGAEDYLTKPFDSVLLRARIGASLEKKRLRDQEVVYLRQIDEERKRSDQLLHAIFPHEIVEELKLTDGVKPRRYDHVAVLFTDIVGFTPYCDSHQPQEVISHLQGLVEAYEDLAVRFDMQKIKTVGDAFMATAGLLKPLECPVLNCIRCGIEMIATARYLPQQWSVRVGIHTGPVVAGKLGRGQYSFDLWGDTVNVAARLEALGNPDTITLSREAWQQVAGQCTADSLGMTTVRGKGQQEVFRFTGFR